MTSNLKCPFCGEKLYSSDNCYVCLNDGCIFCGFHFMEKRWKPIIELKQSLIQAKQDLEQSEKCCSAWETQALDYKAETIALSGKLEIARKAFEMIRDEFGIENRLATPVMQGLNMKAIAEKALEQIDHKEVK